MSRGSPWLICSPGTRILRGLDTWLPGLDAGAHGCSWAMLPAPLVGKGAIPALGGQDKAVAAGSEGKVMVRCTGKGSVRHWELRCPPRPGEAGVSSGRAHGEGGAQGSVGEESGRRPSEHVFPAH